VLAYNPLHHKCNVGLEEEEAMRALVCRTFGPPEGLLVEDVPEPALGAGQVLIGVRASCVNYTDVLSTAGRSQLSRELPMIPGVEAAGEVIATGEGVEALVPGDRVLCAVMAGGFGELLVADQNEVARIPEGMSFAHAAAFYIAGFTTYHALVTRAALQENESLLVLGAGGGAGIAAVQIGKALGARVVAAASAEDKLSLAREAGADDTFLYEREMLNRDGQIRMTDALMQMAQSRRRATIGEINSVRDSAGFDVIYDGVGGLYAEPAMRALAWEGRYLSVGFAAGVPEVKLGPLLFKNATLHGIQPSEPEYRLPGLASHNLERMFDWYEQGILVPQITRRLPLERGAEAMRAMLDRKATGRIVIEMD
jgi:NADPH:quinone reductase